MTLLTDKFNDRHARIGEAKLWWILDIDVNGVDPGFIGVDLVKLQFCWLNMAHVLFFGEEMFSSEGGNYLFGISISLRGKKPILSPLRKLYKVGKSC